jgi:hypothetical protein
MRARTLEIGGPLYLIADQCCDTLGAKHADKETQFKYDILTCPETLFAAFTDAPYIIRRHQHDRKANICGDLTEFRYQSASLVGLLVQDTAMVSSPVTRASSRARARPSRFNGAIGPSGPVTK